jgi:hypothetical protein
MGAENVERKCPKSILNPKHYVLGEHFSNLDVFDHGNPTGNFNRAPGRISSKKRTEISVENARMMNFTVGAKTFTAVRLLV